MSPITKRSTAHLNNVVIDILKVATTQYGIRAIHCVVATKSTLAQIQFFIDDGHLDGCRLSTECNIKQGRLDSRKEE